MKNTKISFIRFCLIALQGFLVIGIVGCSMCTEECKDPYVISEDFHENYMLINRINKYCTIDGPSFSSCAQGTELTENYFMIGKYRQEIVQVDSAREILEKIGFGSWRGLDHNNLRIYFNITSTLPQIWVWDIPANEISKSGEPFPSEIADFNEKDCGMGCVRFIDRFPIKINQDKMLINLGQGRWNKNFEIPLYYYQDIRSGERESITELYERTVQHWNYLNIYGDTVYGVEAVNIDTAWAYRYQDGLWDSLYIDLSLIRDFYKDADFKDAPIEKYALGIEVVNNQIQVINGEVGTLGYLINDDFKSYVFGNVEINYSTSNPEIEIKKLPDYGLEVIGPDTTITYPNWKKW